MTINSSFDIMVEYFTTLEIAMKITNPLLGKNTIRGGVISIVLFTVTFLLISCDNFLNAGKISEDIKETIDYNNAKTVHVNISCEKEMGTIFPDSSYSAKIGYDFEIQFFPNTENYFVNNTSSILEAVDRLGNQSRADCVVFSVQEQTQEEKKAGVYRIKVKVIKDSDIMIRPNISVLPKVKEIYPPFTQSGCNQDTTIKVTFSKPVDPRSFGSFSCINITNSNKQDITSCYGEPFFSDNNRILNIPSMLGNSIIENDSESNFEDVTISFNFSNIKDAEGIQIVQAEPYTFRVNKDTDQVKPVLTSVKLTTTSDTSSPYYRILTNKAFSSWSKTATADNSYGDYSNNHVGKTINLEVSAYDKDSGVSGVKIIETYIRSVDGSTTTNPYETGYCGINKFEYVETDSSNNKIYSLNDTYQFTTVNDGVYKLDISVIDNAGNVSTSPFTYYVIKDSSIESNTISFLETKDYDEYYPTLSWDPDYVYTDIFTKVRKQQNGSDTVVLTLDNTTVDTFYQGCTSNYAIEILYGDSQDSINNKATRTNNSFSFTRNPGLVTFVKIICKDEVGNQMEFVRAMPPTPLISNYEILTQYDDEQGYEHNYVKITPASKSVYSSLCESCGADSFSVFYIIKNTVTPNANYATSLENGHQIRDYAYDQQWKTYYYYIVVCFRYGNTYWYSVLSDKYVKAQVRNYYDNNVINGNLTLLPADGSLKSNTFPPYMKDEIQVAIEPCMNSGCYKVTLDDYKAQNIDTSDIIYTFECVDSSNNNTVYRFTEPTFYLKSMAKYMVYVYAKEKNGPGYYKSQWCYCYVNDDDTYNSNYSFFLKEDLYPPSFNQEKHSFNKDTAGYWIEPALPQDNPASAPSGTSIAGMYELPDKPGYGQIDYYFIPNSSLYADNYSLYTLQDLQAYEKQTLVYNLNDDCLKIPYGHVNEGLYTICLVAKDKKGNYSIKCAPAYNKLVGTVIPTEFKYTGRYEEGLYKIVSYETDFNADFYDTSLQQWVTANERWIHEDDYYGPYFHEEGDSWGFQFAGKGDPAYDGWMKIYGPKIIDVPTDYGGCKYDYSIFNCGFYYVDYIYFPYEKSQVNPNISKQQCKSKNVVEGFNGYQVYCDNSVFAHTIFYPKKLTETNEEEDIGIWETRGEEVGIVISDSDFTYTKDNYNDVPSGYWYTTIIHFADGTACMTEVKKKK